MCETIRKSNINVQCSCVKQIESQTVFVCETNRKSNITVQCSRVKQLESQTLMLKGHCIEIKYYADGIHSGLTPPG